METNSNTCRREVPTRAGGMLLVSRGVFDDLKGVASVESGYMNRPPPHPSLRAGVRRRHTTRRSVQITFDPSVVTVQGHAGGFPGDTRATTLNRQVATLARSTARDFVSLARAEAAAEAGQVSQAFSSGEEAAKARSSDPRCRIRLNGKQYGSALLRTLYVEGRPLARIRNTPSQSVAPAGFAPPNALCEVAE
jgi:peptide methionine sulfoxide reductase MsrA